MISGQDEQRTTEQAGLRWYVAHTRPRCEKKLAEYCKRENLLATLPCYQAVHKYRGKTKKTVVFEKPLFPGYVFLQLLTPERARVYQSDFVANLLEVSSQDLFQEQLGFVVRALETGLEIRLAPDITEGQRVQIARGPLRGIEGWIEHRYGPETVLLRIDFIGQAAAVTMTAEDLERI